MEDADGYKKKHGFKFTHENISAICYTFAKTIEDAGYYSGIYTSASWLQYIKPECDRFDKWVASWGTNNGTLQNDTSAEGTLHQYTSKPLDKNIMYADISRYTVGKATNPVNPLDAFTDDQLADKVIAGEFGAGDARKNSLGARYGAVQALVNKKLGTNNAVYYTVKNGDTLSKIASKYGTTYQAIARMNGISNPNKIYAGQRLRVK